MTDDELNELERLRRGRDEAAAPYDAYTPTWRAKGEPPRDPEMLRLGVKAVEAESAYAAALDAGAPRLVAEVRRLRGVIAQHDLGELLPPLPPDRLRAEVERLREALGRIAHGPVTDASEMIALARDALGESL